MKYLDKFLRDWRIKEASQYVRPNDKLLDIGCFDGYLFNALKEKNIQPSIGLDPLLTETETKGEHVLCFRTNLLQQVHWNCCGLCHRHGPEHAL